MAIKSIVSYGGAATIYFSINEDLVNELTKYTKEFSPEFKEWFIKMKADDPGLATHDVDKWWYEEAMKLQIPGIKFDKE